MKKCKPNCVGRIARKAQALHEKGNSLQAYELISNAEMTPISNPGLWFLRARLAMAAALWSQALRDLQDLLEVVKPQRQLILARIECLICLGRLAEASDLLQVHAASLGSCCVRNILQARIYALRNQPEKVLLSLEKAMAGNEEIATGLAFASPELAPWALGSLQHPACAEAG